MRRPLLLLMQPRFDTGLQGCLIRIAWMRQALGEESQFMKHIIKTAATLAASWALLTPAMAQISFYEHDGFAGRSFSTQKQVADLSNFGFNDRASSAVVSKDRWEVCEDARFGGHCVVLRQGRYASLSAMGLNDRVSSVRRMTEDMRADDARYAPAPLVVNDYRRRDNERLYEAEVTSVRAVVGPNEQRCWVEREQVGTEHRDANVPGAIAGAVIGGILGHQIGGGTGKDLATVGGVVAGAALGSNVGRNSRGEQVTTRDVQRCKEVPPVNPAYWDVSYEFRGRTHRMQTTSPPGKTITVNRLGEPRA
jgi:uncharacterized protein YcfJ